MVNLTGFSHLETSKYTYWCCDVTATAFQKVSNYQLNRQNGNIFNWGNRKVTRGQVMQVGWVVDKSCCFWQKIPWWKRKFEMVSWWKNQLFCHQSLGVGSLPTCSCSRCEMSRVVCGIDCLACQDEFVLNNNHHDTKKIMSMLLT
jgi:hypothetical protein